MNLELETKNSNHATLVLSDQQIKTCLFMTKDQKNGEKTLNVFQSVSFKLNNV